MAEQSWPHPDGPIVDTEQWRAAARLWRETGVVPGVTDELAVEAVPEELQIRVQAGEAWVDGHFYRNTDAAARGVATADLSQDRIDRVVTEYADDRMEGDAGAELLVLTGTPGSNPQPPGLTQEDGHFQMPLFRFRVRAASGEVLPEDIVDERVFSAPLRPLFVDDAAERDAIPEESRTVVWRRDVERFEGWDAENAEWVPGPPDHAHALDGLTDVTTSGASDGDVLTFNAGLSQWEPDAIPDAVPAGAILLWSGSIASVPSGWALCDGSNGTPDLRGRFVVAAGGTYSVGQAGGQDSVALTEAQMPPHLHTSGTLDTNFDGAHAHNIHGRITSDNGVRTHGHQDDWGNGVSSASSQISGFTSTGVSGVVQNTGPHSHSVSGSTGATGSGDSHENRPPFYALAYIMRL